MLSVVRASARCLGCCEASQTWSRRLYQRLQCRQYHQSAWLACSQQGTGQAQEPLAAEASDSKSSSRKQANPKGLFRVREFTKTELEQQDRRTDWDKGLKEEDTFGSLDRKTRGNFKPFKRLGPKHLSEGERMPSEQSFSETSKHESSRQSSNDGRKNGLLDEEDTFGLLSQFNSKEGKPYAVKGQNSENIETSKKQEASHKDEREKVPRKKKSVSEKSKHQSDRHDLNDRGNKKRTLGSKHTLGSFSESHSKEGKPAEKGQNSENVETSKKQEASHKGDREKVPRKKKSVSEKSKHLSDRHDSNDRGNKKRTLGSKHTLGSFSETHSKKGQPTEKGKHHENFKTSKYQEAYHKGEREKVPREMKSLFEKFKSLYAEYTLGSFSRSYSKEGKLYAEKGQNSENIETSKRQEASCKYEREKVPREKKSVYEKSKHQRDRHLLSDRGNKKRTLGAKPTFGSFSESNSKDGKPAVKGQNSETIETSKRQEASRKDEREKVPREKKSVSEKSKHQSDRHNLSDRRNQIRTLDSKHTLGSFSELHSKEGKPADKGKHHENFKTSKNQEAYHKGEREKVPKEMKSLFEKFKSLYAEYTLGSFSRSYSKEGKLYAEKGQNSENIETSKRQEASRKDEREKVPRGKKSVYEMSIHQSDGHDLNDRRYKNRTVVATHTHRSHSKERNPAEKDRDNKRYRERPERRLYQQQNAGQTERREERQEEIVSEESQEWSDTFGLMSTMGDNATLGLYTDDKVEGELLQEEMEVKPHIPLGTYNRRHVANWYARRIIKLGEQGKVRDAIQVFDEWMLKEDRVKPTAFEFTVLIHLLGQVGYTKKAFKLYNQMLRMGITDEYSPHLYTCLLNACANSPWPEDGLKRAVYLRTRLLVKQTKPNRIIYNAMIRAFGMCGDINTAFSIADETAHFFKPDSNLLASLLCACISDKESGFRHAIMVWRKMKKMGVKPELKDYKLLLRAVIECGIGSPELAKDILIDEGTPAVPLAVNDSSDNTKTGKKSRDMSTKMNKLKEKRKWQHGELDSALLKYVTVDEKAGEGKSVGEVDLLSIDTPVESSETANVDGHDMLDKTAGGSDASKNLEWWQMDVFLKRNTDKKSLPATVYSEYSGESVLDPTTFNEKIPLSSVKRPQERLAILGGYEKILDNMEDNGMVPDKQLYTLLMQSVPAHLEDNLLDEMDMANCQPDVVFCNLLMEKRAKQQDFKGTQTVLKLMEENDLVPNMMTYGCIALSCRTMSEAQQLFKAMREAGMEPNLQIMTTLLYGSQLKFRYRKYLLAKMEHFGISPNEITLRTLERQISYARKFLADQEKTSSEFDAVLFARQLESFLDFYHKWCQRSSMATEDHPWAPFMSPKEPSKSTDQDTLED